MLDLLKSGFVFLILVLVAISVRAAAIPAPTAHMSEDLRSSIGKLVVVAGDTPAERDITGSYKKNTPDVYGGIVAGSTVGTPAVELGGITVGTSIPILALPGMIAGGISAKTRREIQDFRDGLTKKIADASSQPLTNDKLARYVYQELQTLPAPTSRLFAATTPVPKDTDAVLYAKIANVSIDVEGKQGVLTTTAVLTLQRPGDGAEIYGHTVSYQDRAALTEWTQNNNQLFDDFANFALYYLGRELASQSFASVSLNNTLEPSGSTSVKQSDKDAWEGASKSTSPALAWKLTQHGDGADEKWAGTIRESDISYDIEVFDAHRPVFSQSGIQGTSIALTTPLAACANYRWSVRPTYHVNGDVRFGQWMRKATAKPANTGQGLVGRNATDAPAYTQDFAVLKIDCKAK